MTIIRSFGTFIKISGDFGRFLKGLIAVWPNMAVEERPGWHELHSNRAWSRIQIYAVGEGKSLKFNTGREVIAAVVRGDAEIGIGFTSEFVPVKDVKVVGALPKEIEFVNEYSAYIPAASAAAETAQALLAYLARPTARDIFKAAGVGM